MTANDQTMTTFSTTIFDAAASEFYTNDYKVLNVDDADSQVGESFNDVSVCHCVNKVLSVRSDTDERGILKVTYPVGTDDYDFSIGTVWRGVFWKKDKCLLALVNPETNEIRYMRAEPVLDPKPDARPAIILWFSLLCPMLYGSYLMLHATAGWHVGFIVKLCLALYLSFTLARALGLQVRYYVSLPKQRKLQHLFEAKIQALGIATVPK